MRASVAPALCASLVFALATTVPCATAGTIVGRATYVGTAPKPRHIQMSGDPECDRLNPQGRDSQTLLVAPDGGLANVVVRIKEGLEEDVRYEPPATAAMLDQKGCMYEPHVLAVQVGQVLEIKNSDATLHNVRAAPAAGPAFNSAMPMLNEVIKKKFDAPEVAVHIKCDVHPWMSAYVAVVANPFFAVSKPDGSYAIDNLPRGTYTVEAWHETLGVRTATEVKVGKDDTTRLDFSFAGN